MDSSLRVIDKKHLSATQWNKLLKCRDEFAHLVVSQAPASSPTKLILSWSNQTDQPDGRWGMALGNKHGASVVHVSWVGSTKQQSELSRSWATAIKAAMHTTGTSSPTVTAIQMDVSSDWVRALHRVGFRVARVTRQGVQWAESRELLTLLGRLPPTPRTHRELPCVTSIDSLLLGDHLVKQRVIREVSDAVPMYLSVR